MCGGCGCGMSVDGCMGCVWDVDIWLGPRLSKYILPRGLIFVLGDYCGCVPSIAGPRRRKRGCLANEAMTWPVPSPTLAMAMKGLRP